MFPSAREGVGKIYKSQIMTLIAAVLSLVSSLFSKNETLMKVAAIIAIVSSIVSIVAYLMYLGLLGKAKKMLA